MNAREFVLMQWPGRAFIPLVQAGVAIGYAEQSCYNMHCKGTFPLKVHQSRNKGKAVVALTDLIAYMESSTQVLQQPEAPEPKPVIANDQRRRRGAPTKRERMERMKGVA